ncbi:MAG: replication factor C large subunit [Methanobacteriota archaeon]
MTSWTEKYRPRSLDEVVGNPTAVAELRKWAQAWARGAPDRRAALLVGDPGVGKTSAALALARDFDWTPIEMNASETRNAAAVRRVAGRGAVLQTFSPTGEFVRAADGGRKLIILDEADNIFGRQDQGGVAAIAQMVQETRHPVVLLVNDAYALTSRSSTLKRLSKTIKFQSVNASAVKSVLRTVATREGVDVAEEVLEFIAERSAGDLRSALNDLESIAVGMTDLRGAETRSLGFRDRASTIFVALQEIFRSGDARRARDAVRELDEQPEDLILWIDHNLPYEYPDREDLARGLDRLSKADRYLGRARRRQAYGMWPYASEMMSSGVATARRRRFGGGQLQFPLYLSQMSRTRALRGARNSLARKLGAKLHTSARTVLNDVIGDLRTLASADADLRVQLAAELRLDDREAAYLLDEKEDSHAVKHLLEAAAKVAVVEARADKPAGLGRFDEDADAE